jgi:endonuclease-3
MTSRAIANQRKKNLLRETLRRLIRMYGSVTPPRTYRGAGLDNLIEAMLSQNTNGINATRGYRMLRRRFNSWSKVMNATIHEVQRVIAICGLARMRARRLQALLATIKQQRGALSIDFLANEPTDAAFDYLMSFHGVGPKTAAFTLLFAFAHPVLPVDNGILRVVRRLRLVRPKARDLEAERVLSPLIAKGSHYATHVLLFRHAKQRCRPKNPKCDDCALLKMCPHGQHVVKHRPKDADEELPLLLRRQRQRLAKFISAGIRKDDEPD